MNAKTLSVLPKAAIRFIEPMYARLVNELPEGQEWLYEVKFDGYRCLAGRDSTGVTLWSRRGNLFAEQFPQIARGQNKGDRLLFPRCDHRRRCDRPLPYQESRAGSRLDFAYQESWRGQVLDLVFLNSS